MSDEAPDPRYSLANERTFLAWIRTALGLLAGSAALMALDLPWPRWIERGLAATLALGAAVVGFAAWDRWRKVEAAIAAGEPPPPSRAQLGLAALVALVSAVVVVLILLR